MNLLHFRDPCVHCGLPMEQVPVGACQGDPAKAVPMRWKSLGVRWDKVEHFLIQFSNGKFENRWEHIEMNLPYSYLKEARYDAALERPALGEPDAQ